MEIKKAENCKTVEEVYACLKELEEAHRPIRNPEELERVEKEIMRYTKRLADLMLKKKSKPL